MEIDTDLMHLKVAVSNILAMLKDDTREHFKAALGGLFNKSLLNFQKGYETFLNQVSADTESMDRWINIQIQLSTELGSGRDLLLGQFMEVYKSIIGDAPGGNSVVISPQDMTNHSFRIALVIRVYGDSIPLVEDDGK